MTEKFSARQGVGRAVEAPVLASPTSFSARYDLDRETGTISRLGHPLNGESVVNKILLCRDVQGGVATGWALMAMRARGVGLAGLVFGKVNPVMVQGAVAAGIPILAGVEDAIFDAIKSGDRIRLDPGQLQITLLEPERSVAS
jgi:predicted aconitase with swiveling domain